VRYASRRPDLHRSGGLCGGSVHRSAGVLARCSRFWSLFVLRRAVPEQRVACLVQGATRPRRRSALVFGCGLPLVFTSACPGFLRCRCQGPCPETRPCWSFERSWNRSFPSRLQGAASDSGWANQLLPSDCSAGFFGVAPIPFSVSPPLVGFGLAVLDLLDDFGGPFPPRRFRSWVPDGRCLPATSGLRFAPEGAGVSRCPGGTFNPGLVISRQRTLREERTSR
jgi:hypothetical protein